MARGADRVAPRRVDAAVTRACAPSSMRATAQAEALRDQRRFEAICARELMGDID